MGTSLVLMPNNWGDGRPWNLAFRTHDLGGTEYSTLCRVNESTAREIMAAGPISWLYGDPDKPREPPKKRWKAPVAEEAIPPCPKCGMDRPGTYCKSMECPRRAAYLRRDEMRAKL